MSGDEALIAAGHEMLAARHAMLMRGDMAAQLQMDRAWQSLEVAVNTHRSSKETKPNGKS